MRANTILAATFAAIISQANIAAALPGPSHQGGHNERLGGESTTSFAELENSLKSTDSPLKIVTGALPNVHKVREVTPEANTLVARTDTGDVVSKLALYVGLTGGCLNFANVAGKLVWETMNEDRREGFSKACNPTLVYYVNAMNSFRVKAGLRKWTTEEVKEKTKVYSRTVQAGTEVLGTTLQTIATGTGAA